MTTCTERASEIDHVAPHLVTCAACAMLCERKRALAQHIGFSERSDVRAAVQRPRRRPTVWLGIPVGLPIAADFLIFVSVPRSPLFLGTE